MARISIVMPTYNRADTILRAVESVEAQTFGDWELVVVDDGSTDGTRDLLARRDPRIRVVSQDNRGVAGARNRAFRELGGELVAFLDSDDAFTPHHLKLASAFFAHHPGEHVYTSEFWEDFGQGCVVKHYRPEIGEWYPATAAEIGARAFAAPPPLGDLYLRVYAAREEIGPWGRAIADRAGHGDARHYRGDIFDGWRWGWLMALQPTVITRAALAAMGPFDESIPIANDFSWLALLCKRFPVSFFSLPGAIKHELTRGGRALAEGHLATGKTAVQFHEDVLALHERLFCHERPDDPELAALRGFRQFLVAQAAAQQGDRELALRRLAECERTYPSFQARELRFLLGLGSTQAAAQRAYRLSILPLRVKARLDWLRHKVA